MESNFPGTGGDVRVRVFVVGTGRCGTFSFFKACEHVENFDCGHETKSPLIEYPDWWIESNSAISVCIPYLDAKYPDSKFVHLIRDRDECAASLANLYGGAKMNEFRMIYPSISSSHNVPLAFVFYDIINAGIQRHLKTVPQCQQMTIRLETVKSQWPDFWDWIGARGDFQKSLDSWNVRHDHVKQDNAL